MLGKEVTLAIAGNKVDLNRVVSLEEAQAYADSVGAKHFSTSAKLNQGLNELFLDLAQRMLKTKGQSPSMGNRSSSQPQIETHTLTIGTTDNHPPPPQDGGCC